MTRSRFAVAVSMTIVALGMIAGLGAFWLDPARAAIGPLPGEALILPGDATFVMGLDVKRFAASPFYEQYASRHGMQPSGLSELEEKTGLNPVRDIDRVVIAGIPGAAKGSPGLVLAFGKFDLGKLGRALETDGKVAGHRFEGLTVYTLDEEGKQPLAIAFLDEGEVLFGPRDRVEAAVTSRAQGKTPLRENATLVSLVEKVRPGSTFWMVGDQSLLAALPLSIPAPGSSADSTAVNLPSLRTLTVTGDLDPEVSLNLVGEAADEPAARNLADVVRGFVALASLQAQQKPELQRLASAVTVATEANRVLVSARFPYELLDALQQKARPEAAPAK
jgi:hypothetical protein